MPANCADSHKGTDWLPCFRNWFVHSLAILPLMSHCKDPERLEAKSIYWEGPMPKSHSDFVINRTSLHSEYQSLTSLSCLFLNCILVEGT